MEKRAISILVLILHSIYFLWAQCEINISGIIADTITTEYFLDISGILNDDLSDPGQGICAIEIDFQHSYLGDVQIELISPDGQSLLLVGPFTSAISPTNLSSWDITFLPCAFPASPDAGFLPTWNNNQAWQILTNYTGSYYPFSGCLEDFDNGSANGTWILRVTDNDAPQTGVIENISLIFCDNTGVECALCTPDAGSFSVADFQVCAGESLGPNAIQITYANAPPDPAEFGSRFILFNADSLINVTDDPPGIELLDPGLYELCQIVFRIGDQAELLDLLSTGSLNEVLDEFRGEEQQFCTGITTPCARLEILSLPDTTHVDTLVCSGQSVILAGDEYTAPGNYLVQTQTVSGCDSFIMATLGVSNLEINVLTPDSINCNDTAIALDGSVSSGSGSLDFLWTTTNGNILTDPTLPVIRVNSAGSYVLLVTDEFCSEDTVIQVFSDASFPQLFLSGGTITCDQPNITLSAISVPANVSFSWTGPNGFMAQGAMATVNSHGTYYLAAVNAGGCATMDSVLVQIDTMGTPFDLISVEKDCQNGRTLLSADPSVTGALYEWSGPEIITNFVDTAWVSQAGLYHVVRTMPNGCQTADSILIDGDYLLPDVDAGMDDSLACNAVIQLSASSADSDLDYHWLAPNGSLNAGQTITADQTGIYVVTGIAANGCSNSDTLLVTPADNVSAFMTFTDTLNCRQDSIEIGVFGDGLISVIWDAGDSLKSIKVGVPGIYSGTVIDTANCVQRFSIPVPGDLDPPAFQVQGDTLTCTPDSVTLYFTSADGYAQISWEDMSGPISSDSTLIVSEAGQYILRLTGENGCEGIAEVEVVADTVKPELIISSGVLLCDTSLQIQTILLDSILEINWSGPDSFQSTALQPFVAQGGSYVAQVTGRNGCVNRDSIQIVEETAPPDLMVLGGQLTCNTPQVLLEASSSVPGTAYAWYAGNNLIAMDSIVSVDSAGVFIIVARAPNRCETRDSVILTAPATPELTVRTDTITCGKDTIRLHAASTTDSVSFSWSGPGNFGAMDSVITVSVAGEYSVVAIDQNGCQTDTAFTVMADTTRPQAIISTLGMLGCASGSVVLDGALSVGQGILSFRWTMPHGSGTVFDSTSLEVDTSGTYILTVEDLGNRCRDSDSIQIRRDSSLPQVYFAVEPACDQGSGGAIIVDSVPGATFPLNYLLGGNSQPSGFFDNLVAGIYLFRITDSAGCALDTLIEIPEAGGSGSIDLGPDIAIRAGDSILLQAELTIDTSDISASQWSGSPVSCSTCLTNQVAPQINSTYVLSITDVFGCVISDEIQVFVQNDAEFYIPNVFSPNNDGVNDLLDIRLGPGITHLNRFRIFSRWGELVYEVTDRSATAHGVSWDGNYSGELMAPGVFTYFVEIVLANGRIEKRVGDITLIR